MGTDSQKLTMLEKVDGIRKVMAGVIVLAVGVTIAFVKNDIPANLLQLLEVLFGGFIVGNVGEHIVGAVHAKSQAGVEVAKINAEANEPEPWDDEFEELKTLVLQTQGDVAAAQQSMEKRFEDGVGKLVSALPDRPTANLAPLEAKIAELQTQLTAATAPKEDTPDYAAAIATIVQTLDTVRKSQEITNKAISILISKT